MSTQPETISDVELTAENRVFLSKAGASDVFMDLLTFSEAEVGVNRHSIKEKIQSHAFFDRLGGDPETFAHSGGGFFRKMWEGDLFMAYCHADLNNKPLMRACFGKERIIQAGIESGEPSDYVRRKVAEYEP